MPNIVTHAVIAEQFLVQPNVDLVLGTTLPDFVGMYKDYEGVRVPLRDLRDNREFKRGIAVHNATDRVFDETPARKQLVYEGAEDCHATIEGIDPQLAYRIGNISTDILMDPALLATTKGDRVYQRLKGAVLAGNTALAQVAGEGFSKYVRGYFRTDRAMNYKDPEWLAVTLQDRFARRDPKLSFDDDRVKGVAEVLERQLVRVRGARLRLMHQTLDGLQGVEFFPIWPAKK